MAYQPTDDELLVRESDLKAGLAGKSNVGHSHSWTEVTGKPSTFTPSSHTHGVADITGTGTKNSTTFFRGDGTWAVPADTTYQTLTQAQVTAGTETVGKLVTAKIIGDTINTAVAGKANTSHTHAISDVTGLQTAINAKANSSHTHTINDISATGTKNSTTFLRGDGTWAVIDLGDGTVNASQVTGAAGSGLNLSAASVKVNTTTSSLSAALELLDTKAQTLSDNYATLSNTVGGKANATHTHSINDITASGSKTSTTFLRGDGTWATPTNTTYTTMTQAEATAGTITTGRVISSKVLKDTIIQHSPPVTAASLTGALTGQVDAGEAMVTSDFTSMGGPVIENNLSHWMQILYTSVAMDIPAAIEGKSDVGHTHTWTQISNAPSYSKDTTGDNLVQRSANGHINVPAGAGPQNAPRRSEVDAALAGKSDVGHTHPVTDLTATGTRSSSTYLRGDNTWGTPTNTTYSAITQAEAENASSTTARLATGQRLRQAADAAITAREWTGTQAQYDAIGTKNPNITYYVKEA